MRTAPDGSGGGGGAQEADLGHAADHLGEHVERKPEDVEERERHEGLLGVQNVVLVHGHVHGERRQGDLDTGAHVRERPLPPAGGDGALTRKGALVQAMVDSAPRYAVLRRTLSSFCRMSRTFCLKESSQA